MSASRHLDAAVVEAGDPAAMAVARVVPAGAKLTKVGEAVLGYSANPSRLRHRPVFARVRLAEIERLIAHRHDGPALTDDAVLYLEIAAALIVALPSRTPACERVARWVRAFTPTVPEHEVAALVAAAPDAPRLNAEHAARALGVTMAERETLRLTTIGAVDVPAAKRKADAAERKRERDKARAAAKRRVAGALDRKSYVDGSARMEAERLGISTRTLRRRRKRLNKAPCPKSVATKETIPIARDAHRTPAAEAPKAAYSEIAR